jgi:hypothetical protein
MGTAVSCPEGMGISFRNFRGIPLRLDVLEEHEIKFDFL